MAVRPYNQVVTVEVSSRRVRARAGEGERLRNEIFAATEALLLETGDAAAVSVRAVAERAACTAPAIYLHFADKSDLLFEVCERQFRALDAWIEAAILAVRDPLEVVAKSTAAFIRFGLEHPEHYRILFMGRPLLTPEQCADLRLSGVAGMDGLIAKCQACIDAGVVAGTNARLMATTLWASSHGFVALRISKPSFDWPDLEASIEHLVRTNVEGLRHR